MSKRLENTKKMMKMYLDIKSKLIATKKRLLRHRQYQIAQQPFFQSKRVIKKFSDVSVIKAKTSVNLKEENDVKMYLDDTKS